MGLHVNKIEGLLDKIPLDNLSDVEITSADDLDLIQYDSGSGNWVDQTVSQVLGGGDLAALGTKNHSDLDQLAWSLAGHTIDTDIDLVGNDLLNVGTLNIQSTIDHEIVDDGADNLVIRNKNLDESIQFYVNNDVHGGDFKLAELDGNSGALAVYGRGGAYGVAGIFRVLGSIGGGGIQGGMAFAPTVTGGLFIGSVVNPPVSASSTIIAYYLAPNFATGVARSIETMRTVGQGHEQNVNETIKILTEQNIPRVLQAIAVTDTATIDFDFINLGGSWSMLDFSGGVNPNASEKMLNLTGGFSRFAGTSGSVEQIGIQFNGFGTQTGATASDNIRTIQADGGLFSFKFDYGTYNKLLFGAGEDAGIGYDGTDFIIEPDLVGTGGVKILGDTFWSGDGTGIPYGHMYTNTTIAVTISASSTPTEVKDGSNDGFTTGQTNLVTFPTGGDEHYLSVDKPGRYKVEWSMSISQNSPTSLIQSEQGIMVNGSAQNEGVTHRTIANSTDVGASASNAILDLAANDQVSLYVENQTSTTNIDVEHANLTVTMVGGT